MSDFSFDGFEPSNTTPVPDVFFDYLLARLSGAEVKVLLYIIRRTRGFKKDADAISLSQFEKGITTREGKILDEGCGLNRETICKALASLEAMGCIKTQKRSREKEKDVTIYSIRFKGEVVGKSDQGGSRKSELPLVGKVNYPSRKIRSGVVGKSDLQETVIQETVIQETVIQKDTVVAIADDASLTFSSSLSNNENGSHSEETTSLPADSTTIIEPSQPTQTSPSTSLPGFEPPTSNPKQQTSKNALEVAKLAMPTNEQVWSAETLVQTLEFHRGRSYPNGAKRKSDRVRDVELEAAKTLMVDASDIWQGHTTEQNAATLIRIVGNLETKWWLDTNGNILPHQLVDKDRIHTAYKRIQTATLMTTSTTTPIDFTAQREQARIKNLANLEKMKRIQAKQLEEQQAGKKRVAL